MKPEEQEGVYYPIFESTKEESSVSLSGARAYEGVRALVTQEDPISTNVDRGLVSLITVYAILYCLIGGLPPITCVILTFYARKRLLRSVSSE